MPTPGRISPVACSRSQRPDRLERTGDPIQRPERRALHRRGGEQLIAEVLPRVSGPVARRAFGVRPPPIRTLTCLDNAEGVFHREPLLFGLMVVVFERRIRRELGVIFQNGTLAANIQGPRPTAHVRTLPEANPAGAT